MISEILLGALFLIGYTGIVILVARFLSIGCYDIEDELETVHKESEDDEVLFI